MIILNNIILHGYTPMRILVHHEVDAHHVGHADPRAAQRNLRVYYIYVYIYIYICIRTYLYTHTSLAPIA